MEIEEFKKWREAYFSVRNSLDQPIKWLEFDWAVPIEDYTKPVEEKRWDSREFIDSVVQGHKLTGQKRDLWVAPTLQHRHQGAYKKILAGIQDGSFYVATVDLLCRGNLDQVWTPETIAQEICSDIILIPNNRSHFEQALVDMTNLINKPLSLKYVRSISNYGFRPVKCQSNPKENKSYMKDLKELDEFFGNT